MEKVKLPPGRFILAVSGGVDSMVLLDMLAKDSRLELTVAHFNHGIREDAGYDEELVRHAAARLHLPFVSKAGRLGRGASEDKSRRARYGFLEEIRIKNKARAIVTAHHQDDLLETAMINLIRGTHRKGLTSMALNQAIIRPLIKIPKADILSYARKNKIKWTNDSTNQDESYLRNYLRLKIMPKMTKDQRVDVLKRIDELMKTNQRIDEEIVTLSQLTLVNNEFDRVMFSQLPVQISKELIASVLRGRNPKEIDSYTISRLSNSLRTARSGTRHNVAHNMWLEVRTDKARLVTTV